MPGSLNTWLRRKRSVWDAVISPIFAERDPAFRAEIQHRSRRALRLFGILLLVVPLIGFSLSEVFVPDRPNREDSLLQGLVWMLIGMLSLSAALTRRLALHARAIAGLMIWAGSLVYVLGLLFSARTTPDIYHYIPGGVSIFLLIGVASVPFRPPHTLMIGLGILGVYATMLQFERSEMRLEARNYDATQFVTIFLVTLVAVAVNAGTYRQRYSEFKAQQASLAARTRLMMSEGSASINRLSAALSHELNTPLGALRSSVNTLLSLTARDGSEPVKDPERQRRAEADLRQAIIDSTKRLEEIVGRMKRFSNLDRADSAPTDLTTVIDDVVGLLKPRLRDSVHLQLSLASVPEVSCRPQQISSVLYGLLNNAIDAVQPNGDGSRERKARIQVAMRKNGAFAEISIVDNGKGLSEEDLGKLFDPVFTSTGGRVATGNWTLFSARQIVREHGGDIHFESTVNEGTTVTVTLPA